ncbi:winged helix-turn-helix domain-containing protein [Salinirubellus salinus]|uniref:Winged helix-turn-helix domain-containing protein n=1 Tax=Salinirubellus salinus TaxID=1364945 RepID=A0A9E7UAM2_9EURY|nr:winged helix-turn-helix domain-containing protein [Salinirubellus salinus]UWM53929.1 winged helix-turn-helix domain-containing protein [Salinirubellus salinus]
MSDTGSGAQPHAAATRPHDSAVTDAFGLLGDGTRLAVLLAIWEAHDPADEDNSLSFSEIFERVDYDDPGNLRYHLGKLEGQFIERAPEHDGYALRVPAQKLVRDIVAGVGDHDERLEPTPIDQRCPFCGAGTKVSYREGILFWACHECDGMTPGRDFASFDPPGPLAAVSFDPAGLDEWTAEELRAALAVRGRRRTREQFEGLCPTCSGQVDARFDWCDDHDPDGCHACGLRWRVGARFRCRTCENYGGASPRRLALFHPAVVSFYDDHGVSTRFRADEYERAKAVYDLVLDHEVELVAEDPVRVAVTARHDGDAIRVTFDEDVQFVDATRG